MRFYNRDQGLVIMGRRHGPLFTVLTGGEFSSKRHLAEAEDARGPHATGEIGSIRPSLPRLTFVMMTRKGVRQMFILLLVLALLGTFILRIRTIFWWSLF